MKHQDFDLHVAGENVAPYTGARIETPKPLPSNRMGVSPPTRGRGLKRSLEHYADALVRSPPTRGRGLKRKPALSLDTPKVSPPTRGRGLKPHWLEEAMALRWRRPLHGGAD